MSAGRSDWIDAFARSHALRYEPDADERWLRAWEPFVTLKTPLRYEHALHATGDHGSITVARAVLESVVYPGVQPGPPYEVATWIAIVQDVRLTEKAAVTSDFGSPFAEPLEFIPLPRSSSGDPAFDYVFASFGGNAGELARAVTPSLRRLLLSWRTPVHAETRPGGFLFAPVAVAADTSGLTWMFRAARLFGEKASKLVVP